MTSQERFVLFVEMLLRHSTMAAPMQAVYLHEAVSLALTQPTGPAHTNPMKMASQFVSYRSSGANRPEWLPAQ